MSFGVSLARDDDTVETLVKRADDALYTAKHGGRNQVVVGN
jgi:PleD family two-component response regulator